MNAEHDFDQTGRLLEIFDECHTPVELDDAVRRTAGRFGVDCFLIGTMPRRRGAPVNLKNYRLAGGWPDGWGERYFVKKYLDQDPVIDHLYSSIEPASWSTIAERAGGRNAVFAEAGEFGLKDGFTVPQQTVDGVRVGASFAGEKLATDDPMFVAWITIIAGYATTAALRIHRAGRSGRAVYLTPREREVLIWIAAGKTSWEISTILGIAERTVLKHYQSVAAKLHTTNRPHTVGEAMRLGILR